MALTRATDKIIANADGNLNLSGIVTASRFSGPLVPSGDVNVGSNIKLGAASGIVTATSFSGDGSNLTSLPAGLGTALSSTQTSPLNKLYYTNEILSIGATVTVDHPATGTGAYTQYADLRLEEGADLIISDGDDVIPDILGLGTDGGGLGAGGTGRIRVDSITNKNANGAPNFPNGLTGTAGTFTTGTFSGAITAASGTITGNLGVGGVLTYEDVTNVDSVGIITARAGVNVSSGSIGINTTGGNEKLNAFGAIRSSGSSANFNAGLEGTLLDYDIANRVSRVGHVNGASGSARSLAFLTGGGERLRVGPAGQLGIGGANYGSSGQVLTSQGSSSAVQWATPSSGLSYAQQWHLTSNANLSSNTDNVLPTDAGTWEKQSQATNHAGSVGSDMSYSSGVFTFPATGIWKIEFYGYWGISASDSDHNLRSRIQTTTNGGSSFATTQETSMSIKSDSTYTYQGFFQTFIFDVTSTSDRKCRFVLNPSGSNCYYKASNSPPQTGATFMRLGDT